jgi:hypothetical protein
MHTIQAGDLVLVTKITKTGDSKSGVRWVDRMDQAVGNIYKVSNQYMVRPGRVGLHFNTPVGDYEWLFPIESLKKVEISDKADVDTLIDLMQI